jgi:hypothetical protein
MEISIFLYLQDALNSTLKEKCILHRNTMSCFVFVGNIENILQLSDIININFRQHVRACRLLEISKL